MRYLLFVLMMLTSTQAFASCDILHADYKLKNYSGITAGFARIPDSSNYISDLSLFLHSNKLNKTYRFAFDKGSARYVTLLSLNSLEHPKDSVSGKTGPLPDMHYFSSDSNLNFTINLPTSRSKAPNYIFLPDLEEVLRYTAAPSEDIPVGLFQFTNCKK